MANDSMVGMPRRRHPGFFRVIQHSLRSFRGLSPMAFTGLVLLEINVPFGWGGAAICEAMAVRSGDHRWAVAGVAVYALSWGMVGLGLLMAGRQVQGNLKRRWRSAWRAWRRR